MQTSNKFVELIQNEESTDAALDGSRACATCFKVCQNRILCCLKFGAVTAREGGAKGPGLGAHIECSTTAGFDFGYESDKISQAVIYLQSV